jgi:hypothetical protein
MDDLNNRQVIGTRIDSKEEGPESADYPPNNSADSREEAGPTHSYTLQEREKTARSNVTNPSLDCSCYSIIYIVGV